MEVCAGTPLEMKWESGGERGAEPAGPALPRAQPTAPPHPCATGSRQAEGRDAHQNVLACKSKH